MSYKAVILVGGPQKGTRFRPLSLECPKPLFPIAGCPTIQHHIESLSEVPGVTEILVVGFYFASEFAQFIKEMRDVFPKINIRYLQEFAPLGTAGGIYHFRDQILFGDPKSVIVINADVCGHIPYKEMLVASEKYPNAICTVLTTEATRQQSINYGCVVTNATSVVQHYVDKPSTFISQHISCGIYVITRDLFKHLEVAFHRRAQSSDNVNGNIDNLQDTLETLWFERDIFPGLAATGQFYAYHTERWWSQIKTAAAAIYANRHCLALYRAKHVDRLTVNNDTHRILGDVYIHPSANVDPSALVLLSHSILLTSPISQIGPNVSIGKDVTIGPGARVRESIILDGAIIHDHACVLHSIIGWKCTVGQWSRVEGTPIGPNPNMPFAKMENKSLFNVDGRLNPAITILGCGVQVPRESMVLNSVVLPHKELSGSYKNQIIL